MVTAMSCDSPAIIRRIARVDLDDASDSSIDRSPDAKRMRTSSAVPADFNDDGRHTFLDSTAEDATAGKASVDDAADKTSREMLGNPEDELPADADRQSILDRPQVCRLRPDEEVADPGSPWKPQGPYRFELEGTDITLRRELLKRLHPYQRDGVAWMSRLYCNSEGGLLADDMGLGKTVQVCALLHGLRNVGARHALVVMPVTLLSMWAKELQTWCSDWPVYVYNGTSNQRAAALSNVMRPSGGVLLTSYSLLSNSISLLSQVVPMSAGHGIDGSRGLGRGRKRGRASLVEPCDEEEGQGHRQREGIPWDIVICDEAHKLKNIATVLGKRVRQLRARSRILLTGTPVQNSLEDLWALMDFAQPGLLGNRATFVQKFADPISQGSVRNATPYAVGLKTYLSEKLSELVNPHLLRRTKESVGLLAGDAAIANATDLVQDGSASHIAMAPLPMKRDTVIWLMPTDEQIRVYKQILSDNRIVREAACKARLGVDVFQAIGLLKRVCNHPVFAHSASRPPVQAQCVEEDEVPDDGASIVDAEVGEQPGQTDAVFSATSHDVEGLIAQSAKLRCLHALVAALSERRHRTLIFSQSSKMLDLIEMCVCSRLDVEYLRIDGKTDVTNRARRVELFQTQRDRYQCMLLTTSVGGFGLNITGADRVVIVDPAWNPATDQQAVDRVYRIGQDREVRVYRLIMSGLIEDRMFRLQVFKMGLTKTALEANGRHHQYFTAREIRGLFDWTDPAEGETRKLLVEKHGDQEDNEVTSAAGDDGAENWMTAGLVVGLSNFAVLCSALSTGDKEHDPSRSMMSEIKDRLDAADDEVHKSAEIRQATERRIQDTSKALELVSQEAAAAAAVHTRAEASLTSKREELWNSRLLEAAAVQRCESVALGVSKAKEKQQRAEAAMRAAGESANHAGQKTAAAHQLICAARRKLDKIVNLIKASLDAFDDNGMAVGGGLIDVPATGLRVTRRALGEMSRAIEEVDVCHASADRAEAEPLSNRASDDSSPIRSVFDTQAAQPVKLSENRAGKLIAAFPKACLALAESCRATSSKPVSADDIRAAQQHFRTIVQRLPDAWQRVCAARQEWSVASAAQRRSLVRRTNAEEAVLNAGRGVAAAEREFAAAGEEQESKSSRRAALEAALQAAEAAEREAAASEARGRKERGELTNALGLGYLAALRSRAAEEKAAAGRAALHAESAKAEQLLLRMEVAKAEAAQALLTEKYEPDQAALISAPGSAGAKKRARDQQGSVLIT